MSDQEQSEENVSLAQDILETIQGLLARPKMFAGNAEALEGQFFNMVVLVAPYAFGMTSQEAGRKISDFVFEITQTNMGLSSQVEDVEALAHILQKCYNENFALVPKDAVLH